MKTRTGLRALVTLTLLAPILIGGIALVSTTSVEARPCCKVMVCSQTSPYACWEKCVTCPR